MRYVFTIFLIFASTLACARDLPANGVVTDFAAAEYPYVKLAGKLVRLAPGARIFDAANRIVQPNVAPQTSKAIYVLDARGEVKDVWLLTAEEVAFFKSKK